MYSSDTKGKLILLAMAALCAVSFNLPAVAADAQSAQDNDVPKDTPGRKFHKEEVQIPGVPHYTGKATYVGGTEFIKGPGKSSYTQVWRAEEEPRVVAEWYRTALKNAGWNVTPSKHNEVLATDQRGNRATFEIFTSPNGSTKITLFYITSGK